jgi:hypothetical protein
MEHAFSADFSAVRMHTGPASDRVASGLGARALTAGQDILFGPGAFRPHTSAGDRLLAHELTHVVQQRGSAAPKRQAEVAPHHDVAESQADAVADDVTREIDEARIVQGAPTRAGQLSRDVFMRELKQLITDTATEELGPFWSVAGCPYIEAFFKRHQTSDASRIEQLAKRYSGVKNASLAADYYAPILVRVRSAVRHWRNGEDIAGDLSAVGMSAMTPITRDSTATQLKPRSGILQRVSDGSGSSAEGRPLDVEAETRGHKIASAEGQHQPGTVVGDADAAATDAVARVHRQPGARAATGRDPAAVRVQLGKGVQLPAPTRHQMEQGFGREFGHVRLHTDETAARLAASAGAMALTVGDDVAFGAGRYRPGTLEGDLLLAHELAHTIQQGTGAGAVGVREPGSFDEGPLEDVADLAAAHAVASLRGVRIPGLPAPKLAPGRAGLRLQGCKDRTRPKLDPVAVGPIPAYDKFTTPDGKIIDTEESAAALASMVQNPDQLDQLWSDAQSGNARAKAVIDQLDPLWVNLGRVTAESEGRLRCLTPPGQALTELLDDESCFTNWSALDFIRADRPGGAHVRDRIALGYSKRARELHIRNSIIIGSLNLLMAGWTVKSALAGEARALGVEAAPPARPRPGALAIPEELKALKTSEIAARLKLPALEPGYHWRRTPSGNVIVSRNPGRTDLPRLIYDPATGAFPRASEFARTAPVLVKPSLFPPAELEAAAQEAIAARDAIAGVPESKTGARTVAGKQTISGWGQDITSIDNVRNLSNKIGHEVEINPNLDKAGHPGSYNLSHAEKKLAAISDEPIGVSRPMCLDCQFFFARLARYRGKPVVVADPTGVRIFTPEGPVISAANIAGLMMAQAAGKVDIEEELEE